MLFLTHLAAAAVVGRVSRLSTPWLLVGAALPDLIDKPLGALGVVELYHSIGHSVLLALLLVPIALYGRAGAAAAIGWGSHLCLDAIHVVINGRPGHALFLLWPFVEPADPLAIPPGAFFWYYLGTPSFYLEVIVWIALFAVLAADRSLPSRVRAE
ncbi:metal-dependent hydrolase [Natronomonas sp.]|uniref:metal-dependent hydrolase n=1 Tax=Natronomonas sp. TaxID=2184060 RepID=UPI0039753A6C